MFERFTERARQIVVSAQDEARRLGHPHIGTEHLLLALVRDDGGLAGRVLAGRDITLGEVRAQVARAVGKGDGSPSGMIPFTPRAKKVLELSLREAVALRHSYISSEHLLLGLVREGSGVAARILLDFDADPETIRHAVLTELRAAPTFGSRGEGEDDEGRFVLEFDEDDDDLDGWVAPPADAAAGPPAALLLAIVLAAVGFPLGLLVGFLVWG